MPEITTSQIKIPAHDGQTFDAYIAMPETTPAPAIILIQEIFGVNQEMRDKCDEMAKSGYIAICPDLFWRIEPNIQLTDVIPEQLERAFALFGKFDCDLGIEDLKSTLKHLQNDKKCTGKIGCTGYCLGGKLAYILACNSDINASVGYYGVAIQTMLEQASSLKNPLMLHIAENDEFTPPEAQTQIKTALQNNPLITLHTYKNVEHAFARGNGMHYNKEAAETANKYTKDFLQQHLK